MVMVEQRQSSITVEGTSGIKSDEAVLAYCPACRAFQTLWFIEGKLIPTRKFHQYGDQVYHDCGSREPCRFYLTY